MTIDDVIADAKSDGWGCFRMSDRVRFDGPGGSVVWWCLPGAMEYPRVDFNCVLVIWLMSPSEAVTDILRKRKAEIIAMINPREMPA